MDFSLSNFDSDKKGALSINIAQSLKMEGRAGNYNAFLSYKPFLNQSLEKAFRTLIVSEIRYRTVFYKITQKVSLLVCFCVCADRVCVKGGAV